MIGEVPEAVSDFGQVSERAVKFRDLVPHKVEHVRTRAPARRPDLHDVLDLVEMKAEPPGLSDEGKGRWTLRPRSRSRQAGRLERQADESATATRNNTEHAPPWSQDHEVSNETCPMTLPGAARISIACERDISAHQLLTGSNAKATAGEPTLPSVAGARSGCRASATSSHLGTPAWHRRPKQPAR